MKLGLIASNYLTINKKVQKGTELFTYSLIHNLVLVADKNNIDITVFASGNSDLSVHIESIDDLPSNSYKNINKYNKHILFELALIAKALSLSDKFDLYHMNIGDGDLILPFAQFVKKPILITSHGSIDEDFTRKYFNLFARLPNLYFVSISNYQKILLPDVKFIANIYNGIDTNIFSLDPHGGNSIMWAGRAVPDKGPDIVIKIAQKLQIPANLSAIIKQEHKTWFEQSVISKIINSPHISLATTRGRYDLIEQYQKSKLFLFPVRYEEAFGLVLIEAMSCGTPVIAYAKGAIPEVIKDGITGFIINESEKNIRGNWIIKKTGIEGLKEAIKKIYTMPEKEYLAMRKACREHVEKNFTIEKMTQNYINLYKKIIELNHSS
jgi:glycosyltransferase involved in cell wall biosynthesis